LLTERWESGLIHRFAKPAYWETGTGGSNPPLSAKQHELESGCGVKGLEAIIKNEMFDFEKLDIYQVLRDLNFRVFTFLNEDKKIDQNIRDQWKKASQSAVLNLAEGTGRMTTEDKKHYLTISRGSIFESVALMQQVFDQGNIDAKIYEELYAKYEQASKMLLGMYRSYDK
jgi:four helix bundle protein